MTIHVVLRKVLERLESGDHQPPPRGAWRVGALRRYRQLWHQLEIKEGVLCRICVPGPRQDPIVQIVLPESVVPVVLKQLRDDSLGGYFGVEKTLGRVRERYYCHKSTVDTTEFIRTCDTCQRRTGHKPTPRAMLESVPIEGPFEMIAMDILELPLTTKGNRYALVVSDYFTRWPEAFALKDQKAETVARTFVDGVVSRHGIPSVLHSDQGPNFESSLIKEMCHLLGITKVRTTPQCDGLVERLNRTVLNMLT